MAEIDEQEVVKTAERLAALDTPPAEPEKVTEKPTDSETETSEKSAQTPENEEPVPNDPSEAGKAFAAMRNRNKELEARLKELEVAKEAPIAEPQRFENPAPTYTPMNFGVAPLTADPNQFVDPNTGEFDFVSYDRVKTQEYQRLIDERLDEEKQTQEAHGAYPELNNSASPFYKAVKGMLLDAKVTGQRLTYKQAADMVAGLSQKEKKELVNQAKEEAVANLASKEAATLEATSNSARGAETSAAEIEYLREASKGSSPESTQARAARLEKLGI